MKGQSTIRPQPPDRRAVSILVRSWTGWRGKPHLTYLAFLEVDRANTPRLDIAALQAEGIDQRFEILKITVRGRTARVHDAFRNSLVVKVEYFFPPDEIFEQGRAARARAQPILVIGDANALIGREMGIFFEWGPFFRTCWWVSPPLPVDVSKSSFFAMRPSCSGNRCARGVSPGTLKCLP